jgi:hypothetical protein
VQVEVDAVLLLLQAVLGLLHVVGHRVVGNKRGRLLRVVLARRLDEVLLEAVGVDVEVLALDVRVVDTEGDWMSATQVSAKLTVALDDLLEQ